MHAGVGEQHVIRQGARVTSRMRDKKEKALDIQFRLLLSNPWERVGLFGSLRGWR